MKKFREFDLAKSFVRKLRLQNQREWYAYCKSGNKHDDIPSDPRNVYFDKWLSWGDWLGTGKIANVSRTFLAFEDAKKVVRKRGLKNVKEWTEFGKMKDAPTNIPKNPHMVYRNEWISFADWLGTPNISTRKRKFKTYSEAKKYVQKLNLKSQKEWRQFYKSSNRSMDIPTAPERVYANEWKNWSDFLGIEKKSINNDAKKKSTKKTLRKNRNDK